MLVLRGLTCGVVWCGVVLMFPFHNIFVLQVCLLQQFNQRRYDLSQLRPGRFETLYIHSAALPQTGQGSVSPSAGGVSDGDIPRFSLLITDLDDDPSQPNRR